MQKVVIEALLNAYEGSDLFTQTVAAALAETDQHRHEIQRELDSTGDKLRQVTASIDRYLRAFEAGTMPDSVCAPRVDELARQRTELLGYRDQLSRQLAAQTLTPPPAEHVKSVATAIRAAMWAATHPEP